MTLDKAELTALLLSILQTERGNGWHRDTRRALARAKAKVEAALIAACGATERGEPGRDHPDRALR